MKQWSDMSMRSTRDTKEGETHTGQLNCSELRTGGDATPHLKAVEGHVDAKQQTASRRRRVRNAHQPYMPTHDARGIHTLSVGSTSASDRAGTQLSDACHTCE